MPDNNLASTKRLSLKNLDKNNLMLCTVSIVIFLVVAIANPRVFLGKVNLTSMGAQLAEFGFFSVAMMVSFLSGGIDISIVGIANLTGVTVGFLFVALGTAGYTGPIAPFLLLAFLIALALGAIMGYINGFLISKFHISPMLVTLGTLNLFMGIAVILTEAKTLTGFPIAVADFGNAAIGIFSVPLILFVITALVVGLILNRTKFGKELRFYGTNNKATAYSGINSRAVVIKSYMLSAMVSSVAGALMVMRVNSARANFGSSYMFTSILCVILGGISPMGGKGKLSGVIWSLVALQLLSSGLNMLGVSNVLKDFIWGGLLLAVMTMNFFAEQRTAKRAKGC